VFPSLSAALPSLSVSSRFWTIVSLPDPRMLYLSVFPPLSPFPGALFTRCLFTLVSQLIGAVDNFGAVVYFQDVFQVVSEVICLPLWQTCFAQPQTLPESTPEDERGGPRHSPLGTHNLHMGFPIGSKVRERFLTQNEQRSFGSEKARSEFNSKVFQTDGR